MTKQIRGWRSREGTDWGDADVPFITEVVARLHPLVRTVCTEWLIWSISGTTAVQHALGLGSDHDFRIVGWSLVSGSTFHGESA